jgi:hypothetical protein
MSGSPTHRISGDLSARPPGDSPQGRQSQGVRVRRHSGDLTFARPPFRRTTVCWSHTLPHTRRGRAASSHRESTTTDRPGTDLLHPHPVGHRRPRRELSRPSVEQGCGRLTDQTAVAYHDWEGRALAWLAAPRAARWLRFVRVVAGGPKRDRGWVHSYNHERPHQSLNMATRPHCSARSRAHHRGRTGVVTGRANGDAPARAASQMPQQWN